MKRRSFIQRMAGTVLGTLAAIYAPALNSRKTGDQYDVEWTSVRISPDDTGFIESREFQMSEIARFFRVRPCKLVNLERATFASAESMRMEIE
jgi:hypothetical protein